MKNTKLKNRYYFLYEWLGILAIFLIWLVSSTIANNSYVIPSIPDTFNAFIELIGENSTYTAFGYTFYRTIVAILISIILGIFLGLLSGLFLGSRKFLKSFINLMRFVPVPCFIFIIFGLIYNLEIGSILISFIVIFPLIYESIVGGIINIDDDIKLSLRLEGLYNFNSIFKVILPLTFPYLNVAIINSIGIGIKISVMSEIILGSSRIWGIGRLIYVANSTGNFPMLFAIIFIIIIIFVIIDSVLVIFKRKIDDKYIY